MDRTVARKFLIGRLYISAGGLRVCAGGLTLQKLTKYQFIYSALCFSLGGLGALFVGLSPPVATGLSVGNPDIDYGEEW